MLLHFNAPAATILMPSAMNAADRMVAVVVPSPAVSLVLAAACLTYKKEHQTKDPCDCRLLGKGVLAELLKPCDMLA